MARQSKPKSNGNKKAPIEEQTLEGMRVSRAGRGFYECSSESNPGHFYHVDILALKGLGECDCWDFISRRKPRWQGVKKPYDIFRCKHLRRVRNHVLDQILQTYIKTETQKEPNATRQTRLQSPNPRLRK